MSTSAPGAGLGMRAMRSAQIRMRTTGVPPVAKLASPCEKPIDAVAKKCRKRECSVVEASR